MKEQTQVYHYMNPSKNTPHFKPLLNGKHLCVVQFRVLKIKTAPNTFEYIITNLPFSFDINDIKTCYRLRWSIETSFRYLKHVNGRDSRTKKDIIHLMIKYVHAVKEELRQFSRPLRGIGAVHFAFR